MEVKNKWMFTSTPLICHHGVGRDNITMRLTELRQQFVSDGHRTDKLSVPVASHINVSGNQWLLRSAENGSDVDTCKGERAEVSRQLILVERRNQKNFQ